MAGSYPDVPSRRMAYDGDGSVLVNFDNQGLMKLEANGTQLADSNNEESFKSAFGNTSGDRVSLIFPELRELDGIYATRNGGSNYTNVESSGDTTNGWAGTWATQVASPGWVIDNVYLDYRDEIRSMAVSNARAVRMTVAGGTNAHCALHVYGEISPGQTPDRLLFIDENTGLEFTLPVDYGDTPRGASEDFEWRIKNNSASLTANTVQYTSEDLYLGSGSWYTHTLPGGSTYQGTQQIASIASATTTGIITTRRITPGTEALGLHAARTYLNVASWS